MPIRDDILNRMKVLPLKKEDFPPMSSHEPHKAGPHKGSPDELHIPPQRDYDSNPDDGIIPNRELPYAFPPGWWKGDYMLPKTDPVPNHLVDPKMSKPLRRDKVREKFILALQGVK